MKQAVNDKDFLLKEINHRIKNNLAMISSLIGLKDSTLGDEVDLSDLQHQIDAIRIVHEKLHESDEIRHISVADYFSELLETIFYSFAERPVTIENNVKNLSLHARTMVPLGLIINEVATNAIKHGFTQDCEAKFTIDLHENRPENRYELTLSNTGSPFPEEIDLNNLTTLGLRLISALVEQLQGTIDLQRHPHPVFTIRFPMKEGV